MRDVNLPPTHPSSRTSRLAVVLLWLITFGVVVRGLVLNADFWHDDAFITLRYAQNLLAGNGIAWNPGDRVEGYTNFLQLMAVSGLGALGVDLVVATRALAWLSYGASFAFVASWLRSKVGPLQDDLGSGLLLGSLPLAAASSSLPLLAWGFGGLEAPLLTLCVTAGVLLIADVREVERPGWSAFAGGGALALACMTRPDAGLFVAAAGVLVVWPLAGRVRWHVVGCFVAPLVVLLSPWLVWKLAYYGDILPNTFHVKATDPSLRRLALGLRYVGSYAVAPPFLLILLGAGVVRASFARRLAAGPLFAVAAVLLHIAWVCFVGGDQMPMHRLLVPIVPVLACLALVLWLPDLSRLSAVRLGAVAFALSACIALQLLAPGTGARNLNSTAFVGGAVGDWIERHWRPGSLVALNTAGSTPFYAPRFRYIDMLGLNDAHIAKRAVTEPRVRGQLLPGHAKGDGAYVLDQRPDYIILGPAHGALAHQPWFLSDLEIAEDERFRAGYVKRQTRVDVKGRPNWASFPETATGDFLFTYYEWLEGGSR